MKMPKNPTCFVCSPTNKRGLNLTFSTNEDGIEADFNLSDDFCSYTGIVHGGILSTILDEGLGWAGHPKTLKNFLTAELIIRYKKPVMSQTDYKIKARLVKLSKKIYLSEGEIIDTQGRICVTATAKYFIAENPIIDKKKGSFETK